MTGQRFKELVLQGFSPFLNDLGFATEPVHLSGRNYRASFLGKLHMLIVSFELIDDNLTVLLVANNENDIKAINA